MGVAMIVVAIAIWMIHIYRHHGVWATGEGKAEENEPGMSRL